MVEVGRDLWKSGDTWFHPLFASFLSLSLARNSLFIHAGLLDISSAFVFDGMEPSLTWGKPSIFIRFLGLSFPPRPHLLRLFWADSEDAEVCSHKICHCELAFHPPFCSQVPELQPGLPLTFRCPRSPSFSVLMRSMRTQLPEGFCRQCNPGTSWIAYACCAVPPGDNFSIYIFSKLGLSNSVNFEAISLLSRIFL